MMRQLVEGITQKQHVEEWRFLTILTVSGKTKLVKRQRAYFGSSNTAFVRTNASLDTNFNEQIEISNLFKALSLKLV